MFGDANVIDQERTKWLPIGKFTPMFGNTYPEFNPACLCTASPIPTVQNIPVRLFMRANMPSTLR